MHRVYLLKVCIFVTIARLVFELFWFRDQFCNTAKLLSTRPCILLFQLCASLSWQTRCWPSCNRYLPHVTYLWPPYVIGGPLYFCPVVSYGLPYVIGQTIIFSCCFMVALYNRETIGLYIFMLFLSSFFIPRLISAVGEWMSAILRLLPHIVWP